MLKQYTEEQVILREGETDKSLYKIVSGKAVVYIGYGQAYENVVGVISKGAYFGEIGAFTGSPSIYTVVAYEDSLVMEITGEEMDEYAKLNYRDLLAIVSGMAYSMMKLKANIDLLNKDVLALLSDNETEKNKNEIRERIRRSDVSKQLVQYQIQMGLKL